MLKTALISLVDELSSIEQDHEEIGDTDVREEMFEAISKTFISAEPGYVLPDSFGMFSDEGNQKVKAAISKFLSHSEVKDAALALTTPQERLDAFQDPIETAAGQTQEEYFGYCEQL